MAERNLSHLNYGHVGEAAFSLETREWSFGRKFTTPTLKQIGVRHGTQMISTEVVPASIQLPTGAVSTRLTDAKDNIKSLLRHHPQLVPVSDFIAEPSVTSAAILSTTATYDPLLGSLFATGSVTLDQETRSGNWESPRRVAATATGEAGNILCLTLLNKQTLGWDLDKTIRLGGVTFRDADQGYWNEDAAPIQQICFAESEDRSNLLAVRLPTRIVIFRPVYWQHRRFSGQSSHYELPASILDARPVLNLDIKQSGGTPHADIAFNPDFQLQFAVVDQNHTWSIWDIDSSRKSDVYTMSCLVQGHIVPKETDDSDGEDGWARIMWVGDVNTVLVCSRRQLSVVEFQGGSFEFLPCPPLFSPKSSDWILDVKRHPVMRNQFLVLTSTSLFLMAVTTSSDALDLNAHHVGTRIVTSWRHYRSAEDFTLSISVQMLDEDSTYSVLRC
jgi:RNA polymerase I-specific transcription initiation factor RRN6